MKQIFVASTTLGLVKDRRSRNQIDRVLVKFSKPEMVKNAYADGRPDSKFLSHIAVKGA